MRICKDQTSDKRLQLELNNHDLKEVQIRDMYQTKDSNLN